MAASERLICASSALAEAGNGLRFELKQPGHVAPVPAFVIRWQGRVYGYLNRCGHVPIELDWQPGEFFDDSRQFLICTTHGALYHPATGACLGGRCQGRGLRPLTVFERDGHVFCEEC